MAAAVAAGLAGLIALAVVRVLRNLDAVVVEGRSMAPALQPADRLLVERWSYRRRPPRPGEVVLVDDPRVPSRELVKRVVAVESGRVAIRGDGPASTDSRAFGTLPLGAIRWRVVWRYWPPERAGRLASAAPPANSEGR